MGVAAPFLGLLIVSRSLREQLSRFILWIGFLLMVGMGVKGFGKADDHAVHSLGFVIVPLLQLGVLLIASVVAFVLDRIVRHKSADVDEAEDKMINSPSPKPCETTNATDTIELNTMANSML